jgi:hypothetical protein
MEKAYGSAFPMKMDIERQILSRYKLVLYPCFMKSLDCFCRTVLSSGSRDAYWYPAVKWLLSSVSITVCDPHLAAPNVKAKACRLHCDVEDEVKFYSMSFCLEGLSDLLNKLCLPTFAWVKLVMHFC